MADNQSEFEIRQRVKNLREFYRHLTIYGVVNLSLILIWAISGGGYFWPIWVIVGWGVGIGLQAISLGLVPVIEDIFPFFSPEWEDQQVKEMMKELKTSKTEKKTEKKSEEKSDKTTGSKSSK
ncbi:MAG: 2TM domain-containing protein [Pseudomonadota bacterium]